VSTASDASEARRILESDVFVRAVANARERKKEEWARCKEGTEQREALWHAFQQVDSVSRELRTFMEKQHLEVASG